MVKTEDYAWMPAFCYGVGRANISMVDIFWGIFVEAPRSFFYSLLNCCKLLYILYYLLQSIHEYRQWLSSTTHDDMGCAS